MADYYLKNGEKIGISNLTKSDLEELLDISLDLLRRNDWGRIPESPDGKLADGVYVLTRNDIAIRIKRSLGIKLRLESFFHGITSDELKMTPKYKILYDIIEQYGGKE